MGGVGHLRCRPWLLSLRAIFLSALVLTSLCYDVLIRTRFHHLVALSPAVVNGQDQSISPGSCSSLSSSPSDSLPVVLFTDAWNPYDSHLRSISKALQVVYHRCSLSARRLSRQWFLDLHILTSRPQAREPITVHSVNPGSDDIWVLQRKTVFSPVKLESHSTISILLLKSYPPLHRASELLHNHNFDDFLCPFINSELCFVFSVSTALLCNAMFDVFQLQAMAKMFCTPLTPHHGSQLMLLLDTFHISDVHGGELIFGSVSNDTLHHQSLKATLRQRLFTYGYFHFLNGGGLLWGNTTNPNALKVLLGPYGLFLITGTWVEMVALERNDLGHDCVILITHHILDVEYECYIILASLSDVRFPVKESNMFSSFTQRIFIPVWVIPIQRLFSRIENFKTAFKRVLIRLLTAASSWSTSEKCENSCFKHLDPIENNFDEHHRWTMCFGSLSFYFSCFNVPCFIFYIFIVWFEDVITMDVMTM